jgi:hypothetical protein
MDRTLAPRSPPDLKSSGFLFFGGHIKKILYVSPTEEELRGRIQEMVTNSKLSLFAAPFVVLFKKKKNRFHMIDGECGHLE